MVTIYIIWIESANLGKLKSQEINLIQNEEYTYNVEDAMPLIGVTFMYIVDLIPRMRSFQQKTRGDPKYF